MDSEPKRYTVAGLPMDQIARDFSYHKPDEATGAKIQANREWLADVCRRIMSQLPAGREASIVKTKLEEAMFWASAALARPKQ